MSSTEKQTNELPTIWRVPDKLWAQIQLVLAQLDPPKTRCGKRVS